MNHRFPITSFLSTHKQAHLILLKVSHTDLVLGYHSVSHGLSYLFRNYISQKFTRIRLRTSIGVGSCRGPELTICFRMFGGDLSPFLLHCIGYYKLDLVYSQKALEFFCYPPMFFFQFSAH